ncbi:M48 family metalloprotease [Candidatus Daviesbacteria bacterium]|nr:M48 family metalloprotease [Candidatus Daviesbacteria bacterium]
MRRINISFYALVFSALTVSLVISALLYKASPLFTSKTLFLCQKFISNIMFEIPRSLPQSLILIIGAVLGIGLLSFLVQLVKTHILLGRLLVNKTSIPPDLTKTLESLSLINKVILVRDKNLFSFCCGIFSPFIVISTGLIKSLTMKELEAVLLHEQSHLINRDPIKVLTGKTFSSMFFFLPLFADLRKNIEAVNELLADQWTISHQQKSTFLRSALKKILAAPDLDLATASNVSGPDYFEIRIHRLINPGTKCKFRLSIVSLLTTFLFVLVSWFLLQTPVNAFHADSMDNSAYFLCSAEQSCPQQCHTDTGKSSNYIPAHLFLPERKCDNHSNDVDKSLLDSKFPGNQTLFTAQVSEYQAPLFSH